MTEYTQRVARITVNPVISLDRARELSGLNLVSAREIISIEGYSYHDMEQESESKSHALAREQAIDLFCSIGYQVFPDGVGVQGILTLADFVAIRDKRIVFVEVLTDSNVKEDTLCRKKQLSLHGELCFVLISGTKRSNEKELLSAKRLVESWADVLYCRFRWSEKRIDRRHNTTVEYDTTRGDGIKVALRFSRSRRKISISANFLTHLYQSSHELPRANAPYPVESLGECYDKIFLELFEKLRNPFNGVINFTRNRNRTAIRAMHRKSGIKMVDSNGKVVARLVSEFPEVSLSENYEVPYGRSIRDLFPDYIRGVFVLERPTVDGLVGMMTVMEEFGWRLQYSLDEFEQCIRLLEKRS